MWCNCQKRIWLEVRVSWPDESLLDIENASIETQIRSDIPSLGSPSSLSFGCSMFVLSHLRAWAFRIWTFAHSVSILWGLDSLGIFPSACFFYRRGWHGWTCLLRGWDATLVADSTFGMTMTTDRPSIVISTSWGVIALLSRMSPTPPRRCARIGRATLGKWWRGIMRLGCWWWSSLLRPLGLAFRWWSLLGWGCWLICAAYSCRLGARWLPMMKIYRRRRMCILSSLRSRLWML